MCFGDVYPAYVEKEEKKGHTKREVDRIMRWMSGYDQRQLTAEVRKQADSEAFLAEAPELNPDSRLITGVVCGERVEDVEEPTMQEIR